MKPLDREEKHTIAALIAGGKTVNAVAEAIGRDNKTVKKALQDPETREQVEHFQLLLADKFQHKAEALLDSITQESIGKLNGLQAMTAAGIAIDKSRLIRGMSNQNITLGGVVITTNCKELQELVEGKLPVGC